MPWKECQIVQERLRFIARLLDGEKMAGLCREFGISRKTGYKIYNRYKDCGIDGLTDRSRRPYRHANQLPMQIEKLIVNLKKEYPHWGAPKIRERLRRVYPDVHCPAISTVHAVLDRNGLVKRRKRRRYKAQGTALSRATAPNELWCADYKGEFMRHCHVNRVGPQRPAWIPFQAAALALSHTLNASFRNRLNVSLLHK